MTRPLSTVECLLAVIGLASVCAAGCRHEAALERGAVGARLVLAVPVGIEPSELALAPAAAIVSREVGAGELRVQLRRGERGRLFVRHPGLCPLSVDLAPARRSSTPGESFARTVTLRALFELGDDLAQVGFGRELRVDVRPGCREATAGRIVWNQLEGTPLRERSEARNGFVFRARMPSALELVGPAPPWGVVPISPRTRGAVALRATLRRAGRPAVSRMLRAAVLARSTGMPSIGLGTQVVLGGGGWQVRERPSDSHAAPQPLDAVRGALFLLDAKGRFALEDDTGRTLVLRGGAYVETPLDCGRAQCHASVTAHASSTRMTTVLSRVLDGALGAERDPGCALACHAVGEPGLGDGGFAHVARDLGYVLPMHGGPGRWAAMPRPLRRLGGVGCTACHGPGAIPEASARNAILASAVCATCHDAPPRYGQVVALMRTAMSRADIDPATRAEPVCAACHTTSAFVGRGLPRTEAPAIGIACAACHAPHGTSGYRLLRVVEPPASLGARAAVLESGSSAVCLPCHAPVAGEGAPFAASALLLLGVADDVDQPHLTARGCLTCHGSPGGRGASHDFAVTLERCAPCHADAAATLARGRVSSAQLVSRARSLAARLGVVTTRGHASFALAGDEQDEARRAVAIVLGDRSAGVHGAPVARALLDRADQLLRHP